MLAEPLENIRGHGEQDVGIGDEELGLVVVADQGQATLERGSPLGMEQLRAEVMALDSVRVVQVVEGVVDREAKSRPPRDEPLVDLGRQPHLAGLIEDLAVDGEETDQRRAGATPEHHLQRALQGEDVRVEARRGGHLREEILDVVELARFGQGAGQVQDLLAKEKALLVVEHRRPGARLRVQAAQGGRLGDTIHGHHVGRGPHVDLVALAHLVHAAEGAIHDPLE